MLILSIDTSTKICSLALHEAGKLVACQELYIEKATSQVLTVAIDQLLHNCHYTYTMLAAIAVAKGPGSYTGLRIGTSTAKGLCYALDKPLLAVSTLEAMTLGVKSYYIDEAVCFCPMIDARRMEVFCGVYDSQLTSILPVKAEIIDENSFAELLVKNKVIFFGDGASKCRPILSRYSNARFLDDIEPSSRFIGILAWKRFQENQWEDPETFEPFYLKEFISRVSISK